MLESFRETMEGGGALVERREAQAERSVREHAWARLLELVEGEAAVDGLVRDLAAQAAQGRLAASQAGVRVAEEIVASASGGLLKLQDPQMKTE